MRAILIILFATIIGFCYSCNKQKKEPEQISTIKSEYNLTPSSHNSTVYVCTGEKAIRYHKSEDCRGLLRCSAEIVEQDVDEAEDQGLTPCKICY